MNTKKILMYFVSFLSLSLIFTAGYYFSYTKALEDFNRTAEERNNELIMSLEDKGLIIVEGNAVNDNANNNESSAQEQSDLSDGAVAADSIDQTVILPTTKYILQSYNISTDDKTDETLNVPSYLIGLNRQGVIEYLDSYMKDMPWNEFREGLTAYELLLFSDKEVIIRKTYNPDLIQYEYYIKALNGNIVVYYSDQKTVYEYTNMSINDLTEDEIAELEEGYFIKDLDELYATLEHYTS